MAFTVYKGGRKPPYPDFVKPRLWIDDFLNSAPVEQVVAANSDTKIADWTSGISSWPMDLNDTVGDCGIAGMDHMQMALSQSGQGSCTSWGDSVCQSLYETLGGYVPGDPSTDNGTVLQDNLDFWRKNPINGSQILAYGALKPGSWLRAERIHAMRSISPLYIGINLPVSAEQQFPNPWTFVPGSAVAGGHCTLVAAETRGTNQIEQVSWGALVKSSIHFFMATCEEAWVVIDEVVLERNGQNQYGFDQSAMNEALASLTGESNPLKLKKIL